MELTTIGANTSGEAPARLTAEARFDSEGEPMWNFGPEDDGLYGYDQEAAMARAEAAHLAGERAKRSLTNKWLYATGCQVEANTAEGWDVKGFEKYVGMSTYEWALRNLPKGL